MEKMLVPTDFSANSKTGMRFAIKLAQLNKAKLIFLHAYFIPKPVDWSEQEYKDYKRARKVQLEKRLEKFVAALYLQMKIKNPKPECLVEEGISAESVIRTKAQKLRVSCICICTRGAGNFKKVLGTTTGNLITQSSVPVLSVPKGYRWRGMKAITYACDMEQPVKELKLVFKFARPLRSQVTLLHFLYSAKGQTPEQMEAMIRKKISVDLNFHFIKAGLSRSIVQMLRDYNLEHDPSLLVMFTNQKRSLIQRIFFSSKSEEMAFQARVPLLIYQK